jgi:pSer/pThr/pTyr-binding forkhead associated (FHA) protein
MHGCDQRRFFFFDFERAPCQIAAKTAETLFSLWCAMSLYRLAYYSMILGGWSAFLAWATAELLILRTPFAGSSMGVGLVGALVGAAIGAAISIVPILANAQWKQIVPRSLPGLIGGLIGGACGGIAGNLLFSFLGCPRALGWMFMGLAIGVAEGLYERSAIKIRNGLIGGGLGGLIGGFLFDPILHLAQSGSAMSSRAIAFVILGLAVGALIGLVQVVLKDAWLTVVDGYRSGRQLILTQPVTTLGRADHLALPFSGEMSRDLEAEHTRIRRQPGGAFTLEDNKSRIGTRLNGQIIQAAQTLKDGDFIKLGSNLIRFNLRSRESGAAAPVMPAAAPVKVPTAPPPPAIRTPAAGRAPVSAPKATISAPSPPPTAPVVRSPSVISPTAPLSSPAAPTTPIAAPPPPAIARPATPSQAPPAVSTPVTTSPLASKPVSASPQPPSPPPPAVPNRSSSTIPAPPPPPPIRKP